MKMPHSFIYSNIFHAIVTNFVVHFKIDLIDREGSFIEVKWLEIYSRELF